MTMRGPEYELIEGVIPDDHARRTEIEDLLQRWETPDPKVLDLGCGDGRGRAVILGNFPDAAYLGVDVERSPEVDSRQASGDWFHSYDGENLPFADGSFDLVYSRQVFEHVRHPDKVAAEIFRVLRPGGTFIGSLSGLEPYHSLSIFNFTPYGLYRVLQDNGLHLTEMRPGEESTALFVRQLTLRRVSHFRLIYPLVDLAAWARRWSARKANYIKLRFAGHLSFVARKPT